MSDRQTNTEIRLGQRIASYHPIDPSPLATLILGGVSLVIFMLGVSGWLSDWPSRWLLVGGLAGLVFTILSLFRRHVVRRIDLHQQGILWRKGGRRAVVLWDEICELYQIPVYRRLPPATRNSSPTAWSYRVVCRDGRRLHLAGYEGLRGLGRHMQRETLQRIMPKVIESFQAGYIVRFGRRVAVSDEGLHLGFKCLSWHAIADIIVDEDDAIRVARAGHGVRWVRIPVSQVANVHILARLLDMIRDMTARMFDRDGPLLDDSGPYLQSETRFDFGHELSDLVSQGYDLEDIREVMDGRYTIEELIARGPRKRPRYPR